MKFLSFLLGLVLLSTGLKAQVSAALFKFPDVSQNQIIFTYANDLWLIPKNGGTAIKMSSATGVEAFPKFSPDGTQVAFTGNYDGNSDVYLIPVKGGIPKRLTFHGWPDRVTDWLPNGDQILFASGRESEKERYNQLYRISPKGGQAIKLPLAYGEFASYSPDSKQLALVFRSEAFRTWKRYRGGDVADIYIYDFEKQSSENISAQINAGEEFPMWSGNFIYFLSDEGPENRMNLWKYDLKSKKRTQLTKYSDTDVHWPSMGPDEIVYEAGAKLYLLSLKTEQAKEVPVQLFSDQINIKPRLEVADRYMENVSLSPDGNRAIIEARGEIFSVPAEFGFVKNLTQSSDIAERDPAWSPDGKSVAFWSDRSGEYELWIKNLEKPEADKKITNYGPGFRYHLFWSPDSKKLAFIDKALRIKILEVATGKTVDVDKALTWTHGNLSGFSASWSPDSKWLTYHRDMPNQHNAAFIFDTQSNKTTQITSGYYDCSNPIFDPEGKYIYLVTNQSFNPTYSDIDNTFIYANTTQIAVISLQDTIASIMAPKNDVVEMKKDTTAAKTDAKKEDKAKEDDKSKDKKDDKKPVLIDLKNIENRMILLPVRAGSYFAMSAVKGKIMFMKAPPAGSPPGSRSTLRYYDIDKREDKTIIDDIDYYTLSANGSKILVYKEGALAIIKPEENQKFEKPLRTKEMEMWVDPKAEWKQIVTDAWRFERDYFYDKDMHGVNWDKVKDQYLTLLNSASTRNDVNFILGEMIAELNASHTYIGGGDLEQGKQKNVGYLGADWEAQGEYYKIKKILRAAPWDAELRSPLDQSGVGIKEGSFILAVNGMPVTTQMEPTAYFQGLAGKVIELTYNSTPSWTGAKTEIVQALGDESRLRHLAWIEANRKRVNDATNGDVGYLYVRSTGVDGQNELIRQFNAQWDKKALIIDERFNNGGQIPDRFIELLNREPLAFFASRDGEDWPWPPYAHFGPKVMLINGWSGSGGDAFPDYFRKKKLGPLIGARTWGGLIGISGAPPLIDGGSVTVPTFRMFNVDGTWFKEGHGVDPDIEVQEDLGAFTKGTDVQLERAILEIKNLMGSKGFKKPSRPASETR